MEESGRSVRSKSLSVLSGTGSDDAVSQWKLHFWIQKLFNMWASDLLGRNSFHFDDLDASESGSVTSSHVSVKLSDSTDARNVSEFLVDVVGSSSRIVFAQNSKVLDLLWISLKNLNHTQDLTQSCLDFLASGQKIPESALCVYF